MAASAIADAGFLVALLSRRDRFHRWAATQSAEHALPWHTCEAALSEAFHLLGAGGLASLAALLTRGALVSSFTLGDNQRQVLLLMQKYSRVPMSFADACIVRMSELHGDATVLTTDMDFLIYRRNGRHVIPYTLPTASRARR